MEDQKTMETFAHEMAKKDVELREEQDRHSLTVRRWMAERKELRDEIVAARAIIADAMEEHRTDIYELGRYEDWLAAARKENRALAGEIEVYREALENQLSKTQECNDCATGITPHNPDGDGDAMCDDNVCYEVDWLAAIKKLKEVLAISTAAGGAKRPAQFGPKDPG